MLKIKTSLKNCLSLNRDFLILIASLFLVTSYAQVGNYVSNGSFENIINCNNSIPEYKALGWTGIDSLKSVAILYNLSCGNVPNTGVGYQIPKHGDGFIRAEFLYLNWSNFPRSNLKNRLKKSLQIGKTYCVTMYVNRQDSCPVAIDGFGLFFGDSSIDTIIYNARLPLTFLSPQISNPIGNIINDAINWVPVTGTFTANGTEKFMVLGNFKSDIATNTISTGVMTGSGQIFSEYFVDAISCIELNLPAYAGPDQSLIPGDSVYIGRETDFAIDPGCRWYQFPNMATPINTISGMWVKPSVTTTYIVRQILDCSAEKWDTVMVYMNPVGIVNLSAVEDDIKLFPNPASDFLEIFVSNPELLKDFKTLSIYNSLGQLVREEDMALVGKKISVKTTDLKDGMYFIRIGSVNSGTVSKRFVIAR